MHFGEFNACNTIFARTKSVRLEPGRDRVGHTTLAPADMTAPIDGSNGSVDLTRTYWGTVSRVASVDPVESCWFGFVGCATRNRWRRL